MDRKTDVQTHTNFSMGENSLFTGAPRASAALLLRLDLIQYQIRTVSPPLCFPSVPFPLCSVSREIRHSPSLRLSLLRQLSSCLQRIICLSLAIVLLRPHAPVPYVPCFLLEPEHFRYEFHDAPMLRFVLLHHNRLRCLSLELLSLCSVPNMLNWLRTFFSRPNVFVNPSVQHLRFYSSSPFRFFCLLYISHPFHGLFHGNLEMMSAW